MAASLEGWAAFDSICASWFETAPKKRLLTMRRQPLQAGVAFNAVAAEA
jgi:hypothetical protein